MVFCLYTLNLCADEIGIVFRYRLSMRLLFGSIFDHAIAKQFCSTELMPRKHFVGDLRIILRQRRLYIIIFL